MNVPRCASSGAQISPARPGVNLNGSHDSHYYAWIPVCFSTESQRFSFLLDTGTSFSILVSHPGPHSSDTMIVQRVTGWHTTTYFTPQLGCEWEWVMFSHAFLIILECSTPLLGRDVFSKLQASITINLGLQGPLCLPLLECDINPNVWPTNGKIGWAKSTVPVKITLKDSHLSRPETVPLCQVTGDHSKP